MGQIKLETVETDIGHNFTSGEGLDFSPGLDLLYAAYTFNNSPHFIYS